MFIIGDMTALTDAPRVLQGLFRFHDLEPARPVSYWQVRRLILDGEVVARRFGTRLYLPKPELLKAALRFGYRPSP